MTLNLSCRILNGRGIVDAVAFSPDGRWFAFSSEHGAIIFVDMATWTPVTAIYESTDKITFDATSSHVWLGKGGIEEWEFRDTPETYLVRIREGQIRGNWHAPTGEQTIGASLTYYVTASRDGVVRVRSFDLSGNEFVHAEEGSWFTKAIFNPDETRLALVRGADLSDAASVSIWTLATGEYDVLDLSGE